MENLEHGIMLVIHILNCVLVIIADFLVHPKKYNTEVWYMTGIFYQKTITKLNQKAICA
jgi:hypothetical protein